MKLERTGLRQEAAWIQWGNRWFWLVYIALAHAWAGQADRSALAMTFGYAVLQLGITLWLLRSEKQDMAALLGAAVDAVMPALIVAAVPRSNPAIWAVLLSSAVSAGAVWGTASGSLVGAGSLLLATLGRGVSVGSFSGAFQLAGVVVLPVIVGGALSAWVAQKLALYVAPPGADARGEDERPMLDQRGRRSLAVERWVDTEGLCRLVLEAGRDSLATIGPALDEISGVALLCGTEGLELTWSLGGPEAQISEGFRGRSGLIARALEGGIPILGSPEEDDELGPVAATMGWRSVILLPLLDSAHAVGLLIWGHRQQSAFREAHLPILRSLGQEARLALRYAQLSQELGAERDRLTEIQEEARKKLARDLHDGPTQVIAAIAMRANFARRELARDRKAAAEELATVERMARSTTKDLRHMLFTLRPLILESQGLKAALKQYAQKMAQTQGQRVLVEVEGSVDERILREQEAPLFYIAEEAVNNAQKHAAAENVWVRLRAEGDRIILEVEDDGVGFNVGAVDAHYEQRGSLGMVTMRERAQLLEGSLEIESEEGEGTIIRALVPAGDRGEQAGRPGSEVA